MRFLNILRTNKIYVAMAVFILAINLLIFADKVAMEKAAKEKQAAEVQAREESAPQQVKEDKKVPAVFPSDEEVRDRQEKLMRIAQEDPRMYAFFGLFNMLILYAVLIGILIDVYLIVRALIKKPVHLEGAPLTVSRWGMGDVLRVVLIFLTASYAFVILQALVVRRLPILYNDNFRMVFNTAMMNLVGISVIVYFVRKKHGQEINAIGLTAQGAGRNLFYAVMGYTALVPVLLVTMIATYYVTRFFKYQPPVQPIVQVFMEEKQTSILWMSTMFAAVFGPVAEEIFFRGFMYPAMRKNIGRVWGMLITSAVFSFLHAHLVGFVPILFLGLLLVYLYEKTGSLVPCMAVHIIHNVSMVVLVFAVRSMGI